MITQPSPNGANGPKGRDASGKFVKGWKGGPGNPQAKRTAEIKAAFDAAITFEDMTAIAKKLVKLAKDGDVNAIKVVLDRTLGKDTQPIEVSQAAQVVLVMPDNGRGDYGDSYIEN